MFEIDVISCLLSDKTIDKKDLGIKNAAIRSKNKYRFLNMGLNFYFLKKENLDFNNSDQNLIGKVTILKGL